MRGSCYAAPMQTTSLFLYLHQLGAYLFVAVFIASVFSGIWGLVRKKEQALRWGAWGFVAALFLICIPYGSGFLLKNNLLQAADESLRQMVQKHHDLSKFVLTGTMLMGAACIAILKKYKPGESLPGWLWPNLLFLSWMVVTFIVRSFLHGYRIP